MALSRRQFLAYAAQRRPKPNVVLMFLDDSGFADYRPFGNPKYPTPNLQKLASQGTAFTNFYVPQAVCSASRSALLSGCFPCRTRVFGAHGPNARGLDPKFETLGQVMKKAGYATGVFGKWHIGDQEETRPPARGFDESCGLMYSNDMWEFHPENPEFWGKHPLRFWENGKVTIERVTKEHQPNLTTWYTEHAVSFIERHREQPFFLYVPHNMPHVPLFVSPKHAGKSGAGLFGDVLMEIDWSVGQIMNALDQHKLAQDTIFIITSDNGPWTSYGNHAGSTPYREAKGTSFDGGVRSACVIRYPGKMPAGKKSDRTFCSVDILPTLCQLTGAPLPAYEIDGHNVWDWIRGARGAKNPGEYYAFTTGNNFEGIMTADGRWKLHVPHGYRHLIAAGNDGAAGKFEQRKIGLALYDMKNDPFETTDASAKHPDVRARLAALAERHRARFHPGEPAVPQS